MRNIRIIDTPPGEAPESVRTCWVGLTLPLLVNEPKIFRTVGVLTAPRSFIKVVILLLLGRLEKEKGFAVNSRKAIEILGTHSPSAADWWKENTPYYEDKRKVFVFHEHVCEIESENG